MKKFIWILFFILGTGQASWGQIITSSSGNTCWQNSAVAIDANLTLTGVGTLSNATVNFGIGYNIAQDRLIYPVPLFGVTGTFDISTGVLKLMGNATTAQYQQIFRTIQYHNISASPAYGAVRTINFTAGDALPLYPCGSAVAHFYKFIPASGITWQNAKTQAEAQNYFGMTGYLATISCAQENNFTFNSIGKRGWIGASDDNAFTSGYSPNGEGQWYWVTGPEAGTRFWQGNQPGVAVGGLYNNWDTNEPNNYQNSNESFAHLLENGRWNDYKSNDSNIFGYFIEFGGLPTDPIVQTTTSKQVQIANFTTFTLATKYCIDAPDFRLVGSPSGGIFKVNGSAKTDFEPAMLGIGAHTVTYELTGCYLIASKTTEIKALPTVSISGVNASYCADVLPITPIGSPTSGTFMLDGLPVTQINPATLSIGNHTLQYNFTDADGCKNSATHAFEIFALPTAEILNLNPKYCISHASFALQASPTGGTFKVNGAENATFDAQALGAGKHIVTYTTTSAQGCSKTDSKEVEVLPLPTLAFVGLPTEYCSQATPTTLQATPAGGTFFLNGVARTVFNPADYTIGDIVTVRYDYTNVEGCSNSLSQEVKIVFSSGFEEDEFDLELCPPAQTGGETLEALTAQEEADLQTANGNLAYLWSNGSSTRVIYLRTENDGGTYTVSVKSQVGCPLRAYTFHVAIKCETILAIPSAFTPNGDGKNDKWGGFGDGFSKLDLRVYNRWGELVFKTTNKETFWDGTIAGKPAPEGVYAWKASYENPLKKGVVQKAQGSVTILR